MLAAGTQGTWSLDKFGTNTTYGHAWHANLYNADQRRISLNDC